MEQQPIEVAIALVFRHLDEEARIVLEKGDAHARALLQDYLAAATSHIRQAANPHAHLDRFDQFNMNVTLPFLARLLCAEAEEPRAQSRHQRVRLEARLSESQWQLLGSIYADHDDWIYTLPAELSHVIATHLLGEASETSRTLLIGVVDALQQQSEASELAWQRRELLAKTQKLARRSLLGLNKPNTTAVREQALRSAIAMAECSNARPRHGVLQSYSSLMLVYEAHCWKQAVVPLLWDGRHLAPENEFLAHACAIHGLSKRQMETPELEKALGDFMRVHKKEAVAAGPFYKAILACTVLGFSSMSRRMLRRFMDHQNTEAAMFWAASRIAEAAEPELIEKQVSSRDVAYSCIYNGYLASKWLWASRACDWHVATPEDIQIPNIRSNTNNHLTCLVAAAQALGADFRKCFSLETDFRRLRQLDHAIGVGAEADGKELFADNFRFFRSRMSSSRSVGDEDAEQGTSWNPHASPDEELPDEDLQELESSVLASLDPDGEQEPA